MCLGFETHNLFRICLKISFQIKKLVHPNKNRIQFSLQLSEIGTIVALIVPLRTQFWYSKFFLLGFVILGQFFFYGSRIANVKTMCIKDFGVSKAHLVIVWNYTDMFIALEHKVIADVYLKFKYRNIVFVQIRKNVYNESEEK